MTVKINSQRNLTKNTRKSNISLLTYQAQTKHASMMPCYQSHYFPSIQSHRSYGQVYKSLALTAKCHKPNDICTVVELFASNPDHEGKYWKGEFVRIYKRYLGMSTPDTRGSGDPQLQRDLWTAMVALDAFFFGGCLTRPGPYSKHGERLADLEAQNNIFSEGKPGHQAYLRSGDRNVPQGIASSGAGGWTTIYIDTLENGAPKTVESIFGTLVHEMAHAVFHSFACDSEDCRSRAVDKLVLGQRGHGNMWAQMAHFMERTIQQWDFALVNFCNTDHINWCNKYYT